jgi:hypothetical protein
MGRFTLRLPNTLHDELESRAQNEGVSLNQYIVYALTRQVASTYTIQVLPEESVGRQKVQYEMLLESLGESSIAATKRYLAEREPGEREDGLDEEVVARLKEKIDRGAV